MTSRRLCALESRGRRLAQDSSRRSVDATGVSVGRRSRPVQQRATPPARKNGHGASEQWYSERKNWELQQYHVTNRSVFYISVFFLSPLLLLVDTCLHSQCILEKKEIRVRVMPILLRLQFEPRENEVDWKVWSRRWVQVLNLVLQFLLVSNWQNAHV